MEMRGEKCFNGNERMKCKRFHTLKNSVLMEMRDQTPLWNPLHFATTQPATLNVSGFIKVMY
jgi:hypothetical protein